MPEVFLTVRLPDGRTERCYSPSTVIHNHFKKDESMPLAEFVARSRLAWHAASERVRARYGYACTSALAQLAAIEDFARAHPAGGIVHIVDL
jgi:uncharacterized repeat protein (TIGR04042 family)